MKVSIIGLGLIGGSLGLALKKKGFASLVVGVEADTQHAEQALNLGLVDRIVSQPDALYESDLVILAVPVHQILKMLPEVLEQVSERTSVSDMGSTKELICQEVVGHPKRAQYVASHPMAGTENSGPSAAVNHLFEHKTAVLCDIEKSGAEHLSRVQKMYQFLNMRTVYLSSSEHDLHAAFISHLSHISSFVLANTILAEEKNTRTIFDLAGGGFESTVRLAKSSPDMWGPIFEQNQQNVLAALDSYIQHLQSFRGALLTHEMAHTQALMENANRIRPILADIKARWEPQK